MLQTLDNFDIRTMDVRWLRLQLALVSQQGILSHHSVSDNLLIGNNERDLTNEYLDDILNKTQLKIFVNSLPKASSLITLNLSFNGI